jgi:hypothetical protein
LDGLLVINLKTTGTVSPGLALKLMLTVSPGLYLKSEVTVSPNLASKPVTQVFRFVPQNHYDGFLV